MSRPSFIAVVLTALSLPSPALAVEECEANGKWINLNNGSMTEQLTGTVRCKEDGKPTREIPYVKGQVEGVEKDFRFDRRRESTYRAGKRHGVQRELDAEGRLTREEHYQDDRELGLSRTFHPNGKVKRAVDHREPESESFGEEWDAEGRLVSAFCGLQSTRQAGRAGCPYRKESRVLKTYQSNGQVDEILPLKNGLLEGQVEEMDREGRRVRAQVFHAGVPDGLLTEYTPEGKPEHELTLRQGKTEGRERYLYPEGAVAVERIWGAGETLREERTFYQNGKPRSETVLSADSVQVKGFWDNGKPSFEGVFHGRSGGRGALLYPPRRWSVKTLRMNRWGGTLEGGYDLKPEGLHREWHENGQLQEEIPYRDGEEDGLARRWHPNGQLIEETRYQAGKPTARKRWNEKGEKTADEEYYPDGSRKNPPT